MAADRCATPSARGSAEDGRAPAGEGAAEGGARGGGPWSARGPAVAATPPPHLLGPRAGPWAAACDGRAPDAAALHPVVRKARNENFKGALEIGDVSRSPSLAKHFQQYCLGDFFDHKGQRRYHNLSMSVAAKRHPDVGSAFGTVAAAAGPPKTAPAEAKRLSARAYRLATEMVERDRDAIREQNLRQFDSLADADRCQTGDVRRRQQAMLFSELPECEVCLPFDCTLESILPATNSRLDEQRERRRFDKLNKDLLEASLQSMHQVNLQGWVLKYDSAVELVGRAGEWVAAAGLPDALGVDRSTFCQFILDLGLADQVRVPYFWAVEAFDARAAVVRPGGPPPPADSDRAGDAQGEGRGPPVPMVCKWDFVAIVDKLLRRHVGDEVRLQEDGTRRFMELLRTTHARVRGEWERQAQEERKHTGQRQSACLPPARATITTQRPADTTPSSPRDPSSRPQTSPGGQADAGARRVISTLVMDSAIGADGASACQPTPRGARLASPSASANRAAGGGAALAGAGASSPEESAAWRRNRRIQSMLVEPEVLQLVEQYRSLFSTLFDLYAGPGGGGGGGHGGDDRPKVMDLATLLQFCEDFHIVPRLASRHEVLRAYRAVECLDAGPAPRRRTLQPAPAAPGAAAAADTEAGTAESSQAPAEAPEKAAQEGSPRQSFKRRSSRLVASPHDVPAVGPAPPGRGIFNRRQSHVYNRGSLLSQAHGPLGGFAALGALGADGPHGAEQRPGPEEGHGAGASPGAEGNGKGAHSVAGDKGRAAPPPQVFGPAAFTESLCRIAFGYLLLYGNAVQQATSSRAKFVWLVAYLHGVFCSFQRSQGRRTREEQGTAEHATSSSVTAASIPSERLVRALANLSAKAFRGPPPPALQRCATPPCPRAFFADPNGRESPPASRVSTSSLDLSTVEGSTPTGSRPGGRRRSGDGRRKKREVRRGKSVDPDVPVSRRTSVSSTVDPLPMRDAIAFGDFFFHRLLRSSGRGVVEHCDAGGHTSTRGGCEEPSGTEEAEPSGPTAAWPASKALARFPKAPGSAGQPVRDRSGRHFCVSVRSEREALTKELDCIGAGLVRCPLTPPPVSPFAAGLDDRVRRVTGGPL